MRNIIAALLMMMAATAFAVPAKKFWRTVKQVDGTMLELMLIGDENLHFFITRDSVPVVEDGSRYCYARNTGMALASTGVLAHEPELRTTLDLANIYTIEDMMAARRFAGNKSAARAKRLAPAKKTHYIGKQKGLIILANFADKKFYDFTEEDGGAATWERYNNMVNQVGYTNEKYQAIGSVHDYYYDQSHGKFNLTFDVVGPVQLSQKLSYYGSNKGGDDARASEMIVECCQLADSLVDFNDYDWDGDGEVEEVFVLYAGYGEATGGNSNTVWPHMWTMEEAVTAGNDVPKDFQLDNARINVYACSNELYLSSGHIEMGIGTICHEFSHCLGLPDFYDTSYRGNFGLGEWDILSSGNYNGPKGLGWVPAGFSAYEREFAGWISLIELKNDRKVVEQKPLTEKGNAYVIYNDACHDEYYILENRDQKGWDAFLPGKGLLIVHVDYDADLWESNIVNTTGFIYKKYNSHQRMTVFHASNSLYGGDEAFPYEGNDSLTDNSTPAAILYNANLDGTKHMHKPITEIQRDEETGYVSFRFENRNDYDDIQKTDFTRDGMMPTEVYTIDGIKVGTYDDIRKLNEGVYAVKYSDGSTRKIIIKHK